MGAIISPPYRFLVHHWPLWFFREVSLSFLCGDQPGIEPLTLRSEAQFSNRVATAAGDFVSPKTCLLSKLHAHSLGFA